MDYVDGIICPKCGDYMEIRIGRSVYNHYGFYCGCGEFIDV